MSELPTVFIPCLLGSARLYADQIPALWRFGPVTVASHHHDDSVAAMAARILATAPPRFTLVGLSLGGYLAFEVLRQAADRVARLVLLDTSARPDSAEPTRMRLDQIALTRAGQFEELVDNTLFELWVRQERRGDAELRRVVRRMAEEVGPDGFIRQQTAIMNRPDSRPDLAGIGCPTLVVVGAEDGVTTPAMAQEIADGIAGAWLVRIPACGHLSTLEQPAAVTEVLVDWLASEPGRPHVSPAGTGATPGSRPAGTA